MATRFTRNLRNPDTGKISGREIWIRLRGAFAVLVSLSLLGVGGTYVYSNASEWWVSYRTATDYEGEGAADVQVTIPPGTPLTQISDILVSADVVKDAKTFEQVVAQAGTPNIQAGRYKLKTQLPAQAALAMLLDKANMIHNRMTLVEGKWLTDEIATMAKATGLPAKDYQKLLNKVADPASIGLPAWFPKNASAEGYVFPDTYELPDKPTAAVVVKMTTKQFSAIAQKVDLEGQATVLSKQYGLKLKASDLVIVASIIEREVNQPDDRAKVAQVIYNRLKKGMPLGLDSTIVYAVKKPGVLELTKADLNTNSPYNTRKFKGLPPGPISNPGEAALTAAANPSGDTSILYFTTVNPSTGQTVFCADQACIAKANAQYKAWCDASDANHVLCYGTKK